MSADGLALCCQGPNQSTSSTQGNIYQSCTVVTRVGFDSTFSDIFAHMLAHTENQGGLRTHEPLRNSTLRQVTSTDEDPEDGVTPDTGLGHLPLFTTSQLGEPKHFQRIVRLSISDGLPRTSCALLDPTTFHDEIAKGRLITIGPAPDTGVAVEGQPRNGNGNEKADRTSAHELADGNHKHLFTTEPLASNPSSRTPDVQVRTILTPIMTF